MIRITSDILSSALTRISGIVDRKSNRPILNNCLFSIVDNHLWIYATDLEVSAKIGIKVVSDISNEEKFCVNLKQLLDILRELPKSEIQLINDHENNLLNIKSGESDFSILTADIKEFPTISFEHGNFSISLKSEDIIKIVEKVSYAMSQDETRIFLNGVFVHQAEGYLKAVAIDGHRLALIELPNHQYNNALLNNGILIPRKGISELKRIAIDSQERARDILLYIDQSFITAILDDDETSIRLISRDYPKYQSVIPAKCNMQVKLSKDTFLSAVKRVRLLSNEQTHGIRLKISNQSMLLSSSHSSMGKANEKITIEYDGVETEISLNGKYLVEALNSIEDNNLIIEFNNSQSPLVIKSKNDQTSLNIIMPLRL